MPYSFEPDESALTPRARRALAILRRVDPDGLAMFLSEVRVVAAKLRGWGRSDRAIVIALGAHAHDVWSWGDGPGPDGVAFVKEVAGLALADLDAEEARSAC